MDDLKLTLTEHLQELRARLWRIVIAVIVLGGLALVYARELFELLMRPVLAALPEESRSLVYTSGIEELNVLLKVGLYAGLFLAVPVTLYQLWKFVAPGLLQSERRMAGPFVSLGSLFFLAGALFCYFAVLPSMFQFLLSPAESGALRGRIELARARGDDASRLLLLGEGAKARELAQKSEQELEAPGDGRVAAPGAATASRVELGERLERFGRLLDATIAARPSNGGELVAPVMLHGQARTLLAEGRVAEAARSLELAVVGLGSAMTPEQTGALPAVWSAQRRLAAASTALGQQEWTRPMLSMREQLSLVLVLELAFGAIFELPLLMAALALLGLLRFKFVWRSQRYAMVACVAAAAILTPTGDAVNLALMAVPMAVCFELGVLLVWVFERRRERGQEAAAPSEPTPAD